jgi:hypothetical protein
VNMIKLSYKSQTCFECRQQYNRHKKRRPGSSLLYR